MIDRFLQSTIFYALRDLVSFVQFKNVKNTHGGVLLLVELPAKSLITYMNPSTLIVDAKFLPYRLFRIVLYNNCKKKFNYILQVVRRTCVYQVVKMFVFRKTWRASLSCYLRFEIRPFALLPTNSWRI